MPTGYIMESCPMPWKCQEEKGKARERKRTGSGKRGKKRERERKGEDVRICPLEDMKNFQRYNKRPCTANTLYKVFFICNLLAPTVWNGGYVVVF